jgi:hypothetical protein
MPQRKNPLARVFLFQLVFENMSQAKGFAGQQFGGSYFFKLVQYAGSVRVVE